MSPNSCMNLISFSTFPLFPSPYGKPSFMYSQHINYMHSHTWLSFTVSWLSFPIVAPICSTLTATCVGLDPPSSVGRCLGTCTSDTVISLLQPPPPPMDWGKHGRVFLWDLMYTPVVLFFSLENLLAHYGVNLLWESHLLHGMPLHEQPTSFLPPCTERSIVEAPVTVCCWRVEITAMQCWGANHLSSVYWSGFW